MAGPPRSAILRQAFGAPDYLPPPSRAGLLEYSLLLALITITAAVGINLAGTNLSDNFYKIALEFDPTSQPEGLPGGGSAPGCVGGPEECGDGTTGSGD